MNLMDAWRKNLPGRVKSKSVESEAGGWINRPGVQKVNEQDGRVEVAEVEKITEARLCTYNWLSTVKNFGICLK